MRTAPFYFIGQVASAFSVMLVFISAAVSQQHNGGRLLDLTHPFDESTIYWPTEDGFKLLREAAGITEQGYYYAANRFMCAEHGGTHLDAPIHFLNRGSRSIACPWSD